MKRHLKMTKNLATTYLITRYDNHFHFTQGNEIPPNSYLNDWCSNMTYAWGYWMLADVQRLDINMVTLFSEYEWKLHMSAVATCNLMQSMHVISLKSRTITTGELVNCNDHFLSWSSAWAQIIDPLSAKKLSSNILSLALLACSTKRKDGNLTFFPSTNLIPSDGHSQYDRWIWSRIQWELSRETRNRHNMTWHNTHWPKLTPSSMNNML